MWDRGRGFGIYRTLWVFLVTMKHRAFMPCDLPRPDSRGGCCWPEKQLNSQTAQLRAGRDKSVFELTSSLNQTATGCPAPHRYWLRLKNVTRKTASSCLSGSSFPSHSDRPRDTRLCPPALQRRRIDSHLNRGNRTPLAVLELGGHGLPICSHMHCWCCAQRLYTAANSSH